MPEPFSLDRLKLDDESPYQALLDRCPKAVLRRYADGELLVEEGAGSAEVYLLLQGACVVETAPPAESRKPPQSLAIINATPGEPAFIGEMATLRSGLRSANVRCSGAVFAVVLPPEGLQTMIDELPFLTRCLCRQFASRLQEANQLIKDYQKQTALDAQLVVRQPGETIFQKGQPANLLYQLVEGTVRIGEKTFTAAQLPEGFLDPAPYFQNLAHEATASAETAAMLVAISRHSIEAAVRRYPNIIINICRQEAAP